jgi:hypothetical protein
MPEERSTSEHKLPERLWRDLEQAEAQHLSYAQLEAYVDSRLESTEAELVRAHAELCADCAAELEDLTRFAIAQKTRELPKPVRLGMGERIAAWFRIPRHAWATVGAVALLTVIIAIQRSPDTPSNGGAAAALVGTRPVEAVFESREAAPGGTFTENGRPYRVLTQDERGAYQKDLAAAPDDPESRGAVAIKYSLFGEAEKEYRKLEAAGGEEAQKGRSLLQKLDQLRGGR